MALPDFKKLEQNKTVVPTWAKYLEDGCHLKIPLQKASEKLVLQYNSNWSDASETVHPIWVSECYSEKFEFVQWEEYWLEVSFTRESWNGRIKACHGVGASLSETEVAA